MEFIRQYDVAGHVINVTERELRAIKRAIELTALEDAKSATSLSTFDGHSRMAKEFSGYALEGDRMVGIINDYIGWLLTPYPNRGRVYS